MPHVFISYVRENQDAVDRLCDDLESRGIEVWKDRERILPGQRWQDAIRSAIQEGAFFIACFSKEYLEKDRSFMNEELTLAIEEARKRHTHRTWFIPVLLSECTPPDRSIGAGDTLRSLQWISLHEDWEQGVDAIEKSVKGTVTASPKTLEPPRVACIQLHRLESPLYPLDFFNSANRWVLDIVVDGVSVGELKSGEARLIEVSPGKHRFFLQLQLTVIDIDMEGGGGDKYIVSEEIERDFLQGETFAYTIFLEKEGMVPFRRWVIRIIKSAAMAAS